MTTRQRQLWAERPEERQCLSSACHIVSDIDWPSPDETESSRVPVHAWVTQLGTRAAVVTCWAFALATAAHANFDIEWFSRLSPMDGAYNIAVDSENRLWGVSNHGKLSRYSKTGELEQQSPVISGFNADAIGFLPDGTLIVGGAIISPYNDPLPFQRPTIYRFDHSGQPLGFSSYVNDRYVYSAAIGDFAIGATDFFSVETGQGQGTAYQASISKHGNDGELIWTNFVDSSSAIGLGVARDSSGNSYLTGYTLTSLSGFTSAGDADWFLSKYDPDGNLIFSKQFGTDICDVAQEVVVDAVGNVFVAGQQGCQHADPDIQATLTKLDPAGNILWTQSFGGMESDYAQAIALGTDGNIWIAGVTHGNIGSHRNVGYSDAFVAAIDTEGNLLDFDFFASPDFDFITDLAVDSDGNVYAAGYGFRITLDGEFNFLGKLARVPEPNAVWLLALTFGMTVMWLRNPFAQEPLRCCPASTKRHIRDRNCARGTT